jgi:hypothetical protein
MPVDLTSLQAFSFKTFNMEKFNANELFDRNYRENDTVYLAFTIKSLRTSSEDELWLHSNDNHNNIWLKQDAIVYGEAFKYRDGDIVNYNGSPGKVVQGFNNDWYVLSLEGCMYTLNPDLINRFKQENEF